jgi:N-acetylmuramoyl-L-alanine amidase
MNFLSRSTYYIFIASLIISCASNPYVETNKIHKKQSKLLTDQLNTFPPEQLGVEAQLPYGEHWAGTTNFNLRKPNFVILHHTAQDSLEQTISTFTKVPTQVSAHYVIGKNGKIYHMLNDYYRAWHGGAGKWGNTTDLNSASIGIELDNNGFEPFSPLQIQSLVKLLGVLKEKHKIPAANFIGHSDIAPGRKVDPNPTFPWKLLAEEGFGLWYDEIEEPVVVIDGMPRIGNLNIPVSEGESIKETPAGTLTDTTAIEPYFDAEMALRIIGYDTSNLDAAIKSFKLHFIQSEVNGELTERDLKILENLYKKYM